MQLSKSKCTMFPTKMQWSKSINQQKMVKYKYLKTVLQNSTCVNVLSQFIPLHIEQVKPHSLFLENQHFSILNVLLFKSVKNVDLFGSIYPHAQTPLSKHPIFNTASLFSYNSPFKYKVFHLFHWWFNTQTDVSV